MRIYFLYMSLLDHATRADVAEALAGESLAGYPGWTDLDVMEFLVSEDSGRGAAVIGAEYGILPDTLVTFSIDKDRSPEGSASVRAAVKRLVQAVDGDLVLVAPDDRPMLWRHNGRVVLNREMFSEAALGERAEGWQVGTAADLPARIPFPPELE